jgi:hypothetical protein
MTSRDVCHCIKNERGLVFMRVFESLWDCLGCLGGVMWIQMHLIRSDDLFSGPFPSFGRIQFIDTLLRQ